MCGVAADAGPKSDTPVVFVHGLSEDASAWRYQLPALTAKFDALSYDVRGFGMAPVAQADASIEQLADDLASVVAATGARRAHVVGFSMGGVIAQRFAMSNTAAVASLALIATSCTVGRRAAAFFDERIAVADGGDIEELRLLNRRDAMNCFAVGDGELRDDYARLRVGAVTSLAGYANACRAMRTLRDRPITPHLGELKVRTLILAGENDPYCPPRAAEMIASSMPDARVVVLADAGHCLHWEFPDQVNQLLTEFLSQVGDDV